MPYYNGLGKLVATSGAVNNWISNSTATETQQGTNLNDQFYGVGHDTLIGGAGDDSYTVWDASTIIEQPNGGIDTLTSYVPGVNKLPDNVENLTLAGAQGWYAQGNELDNIIIAGAGNVQIDGGAGNDVLVGGSGADTFIFAKGNGSDAIYNFKTGTDTVRLDGYGLTSFAQVQSIMSQAGVDTKLSFATGEVLMLRGVTASTLTASNFALQLDTSKLRMTFDDEFNSLNVRKDGGTWQTSYGFGGTADRGLPGEQEVYVDKNYAGTGSTALGLDPFSISNGVLSITAALTPAAAMSALSNQPYTSGLLSSKGAFSQQYGYFEIRAKLPAGQGFLPEFWLMPADGSWPPEMDIMESLGRDPGTIYMSTHTGASGQNITASNTTYVDPNVMHTYGLNWTKDSLTWYIDGTAVAKMATPAQMTTQEFYVIINMAVGNDWAGKVDGTTGTGAFQIDYVRAYANEDTVSQTLNGVTTLLNGTADPALDAVSNTSVAGVTKATTGTADPLVGGAGDDRLIVGAGNHVVNGGAGVDTLVLSGKEADYSVLTGSGYTYLVTKGSAVKFSGIETVEFADKTVSTADAIVRAPAFDGLRYIASQPDLIKAFGNNAAAGVAHYLSNGFAEGRDAEAFDPAAYLAAYPDLKAAFGNDGTAAETHFIQRGYAEGRNGGYATVGATADVGTTGGTPDLAVVAAASVVATITAPAAGMTLATTGATDTLTGTAGDDRLIAGAGNHVVDGGAGNDTLVESGKQADYSVLVSDGATYLVGKGNAQKVTGIETVQFADTSLSWADAVAQAPAFDGLRYIASYGDLITAFGADAAAGISHYVTHGFAEDRDAEAFDPAIYLSGYADLQTAFGSNLTAAESHYIQNGYAEGRSASPAPFAGMTLATTGATDALTGTVGDDRLVVGAGNHVVDGGGGNDTLVVSGNKADYSVLVSGGATYLIGKGNAEKVTGIETVQFADTSLSWADTVSQAPAFDALRYIASYADLTAAFGADAAAGISHYVTYGFAEDRDAKAYAAGAGTFSVASAAGREIVADGGMSDDILRFTGTNAAGVAMTQSGSSAQIDYGNDNGITITSMAADDHLRSQMVFA